MRASDSGTSDRSFLRLGRKTILAKALMRRCACVRVGGVQHTGELLGRVTVLLDEVRRMQAGRQILPLVGRARGRTATSGSITVEVRTACRIGSNSPLSSADRFRLALPHLEHTPVSASTLQSFQHHLKTFLFSPRHCTVVVLAVMTIT